MDQQPAEESFETMVPVAIRLLTKNQFQKLVSLGQNPARAAAIGSHVTLLVVIDNDEVEAAQAILDHSGAAQSCSDVHTIAAAALAVQSICGTENLIHFAATQNLPPHYQAAVDRTFSEVHQAIQKITPSYTDL